MFQILILHPVDFTLCLGKFSCVSTGARVCVLTRVNDEAYGVLAQSVIKRNHNHGVGVAGQL